MQGCWTFFLILWIAPGLFAASGAPIHSKNLRLIGIIHVQGVRADEKSVAVLREKLTGRTHILHRGERIPDTEWELSELGPQHIFLLNGEQSFMLRVENQDDSTVALTEPVEQIDTELVGEGSQTIIENFVPPAVVRNLMQPSGQPLAPQVSIQPCIGNDCPATDE